MGELGEKRAHFPDYLDYSAQSIRVGLLTPTHAHGTGVRAQFETRTHARTYARSAVTLLTAALPVGLKQSGHCNAFSPPLSLSLSSALSRTDTVGRARPHSDTCLHVASILNYIVKYVEP